MISYLFQIVVWLWVLAVVGYLTGRALDRRKGK